LVSKAPFKATHGVLLADEVHGVVARRLNGATADLLGSNGAATNHQHAHWVPIPNGARRGATIGALVVWVPRGLTAREVAAIVSVREVSGRTNGRGDDDGYEVKGFPQSRLLLQAAGQVADVAPEFGGRQKARRWRSLTPYLPVRHRKRRETLDEYLAADVRAELGYRGKPEAVVTRLYPHETLPDRWALEFRRYRRRERLWHARPGLGLTLEFDQPVEGPLLLGQLSHFGYGIFVPE
jgi:CRISPR-associated protein Csb2